MAFTLSLVLQTTRAADLNWDPNGGAFGAGGSGVWDTNSLSWNGGTAAWNNATPDNAIFGGTPGTVSLAVPITAHNLTFTSRSFFSGYVISGGTLTLTGSSPTIATSIKAGINSAITGSDGLIKSGSGTLTLTSVANSWMGGTTLNGGSLQISADSNLGAESGSLTFDGGTLWI